MAEVSSGLVQAAAAFGLDAAQLRPLAGNSGSAWDAGGTVLRVGPRPRMAVEVAAATAAANVVPVPRVIDRADFGGMTAVLLERLPGHDAGSVALRTPRWQGRSAVRAVPCMHAWLRCPLPASWPALRRRMAPHGGSFTLICIRSTSWSATAVRSLACSTGRTPLLVTRSWTGPGPGRS